MGLKGLLLAVIVVSLVFSIVFSVKSFTGYITADEVNNGMNSASLVLFLIGVIGSFFWLKRYKVRR